MKYKAVLFDLDETLIRTNIDLDKSLFPLYEYLYKELKVMVKFKEFKELNQKIYQKRLDDYKNELISLYQFGKLIWYDMLKEMGILPSPNNVDTLYSLFNNSIEKSIKREAGALEILRWLKEHNILIGVVSNGDYHERIIRLKKSGLIKYVDCLVSSDLTMKDKPEPDSILIACKYLKINPEETIFIGDQLKIDIEASKRANIGISILYNQSSLVIDGTKNIYSLLDLKKFLS